MKKVLLSVIFCSLSLFAQTNSGPATMSIDGYAARVNNRIITYGDVREQVAPIMQPLFQRYRGEELARQLQELYVHGRETLIEETLMLEEAKRLEYALPRTVIESEVQNTIQSRFDGDRARLSRALAERRMTFQEWRQEVADRLLVQVYYNQEILRNINVTEEDVQAEYERIKHEEFFIPFRVKYRFILINKGKTEDEQAVKRKQAEDILQKLRAGADFAALAEDVSEGDTSLSPWRDPADVKEILRPALLKTPAGGVSDLIEADTVFYIINVESRQEEGFVSLDEVRNQMTARLRERERDRLHRKLIERLSARHYIQRY